MGVSGLSRYGEEGSGLLAWTPSFCAAFAFGGSLLNGTSLGGPALGGIGAMSLRFGDVSCLRELSTLDFGLFGLSEGVRSSCDDTNTRKSIEKAQTVLTECICLELLLNLTTIQVHFAGSPIR